MLSISAFNALLKIIEDPPEHLLFILATTELHKVPATILSRCQRFSFRRISQEDIAARLQYVAYQENIDLDDSAAKVLARLADGGMRDGLSLLDQCASATTGELTAEKVYACLGIAGIQECATLMGHIADRDTPKALAVMSRLYADGKDLGALLDELACLTRDLLVLKTAPGQGINLLSGIATDAEAKALANRMSAGELMRNMTLLQSTMAAFTRSASRRMDAELCIVNMCQPELNTDTESIIARLTSLEDQLKSGCFTTAAAPVQPVTPEEPEPEEPVRTTDLQAEEIRQPEIPEERQPVVTIAEPVGFWTDLAIALHNELKPPYAGFFTTSAHAPIKGELRGDKLMLICANQLAKDIVDKPEVLQLVARKASARLGTPIRVVLTDDSAPQDRNGQMEKLLNFGRAHSDIITIQNEGE